MQRNRSRRISLEAMRRVCAEFRPFQSARAVLVADPAEDIFRGIPGGYGKVSGAPALVAFVGNMESPDVQEALGYTGEGVILEATALGLATCWVGGFFSPKRAAAIAKVAPNERVLAVTPVGYAKEGSSLQERAMSRFGRNWQRRPIERPGHRAGREGPAGLDEGRTGSSQAGAIGHEPAAVAFPG